MLLKLFVKQQQDYTCFPNILATAVSHHIIDAVLNRSIRNIDIAYDVVMIVFDLIPCFSLFGNSAGSVVIPVIHFPVRIHITNSIKSFILDCASLVDITDGCMPPIHECRF